VAYFNVTAWRDLFPQVKAPTQETPQFMAASASERLPYFEL
jgi:hypothetical protein